MMRYKSPCMAIGAALFAYMFFPCAQNALGAKAAAVVDDGYAGKVLQKILDKGNLNIEKREDIRLSLDDEGKLIECRVIKGSDTGKICAAARSASPFGTPPYGLPISITLSFWTGQTAASGKSTSHAETQNLPPAAPKNDTKYLAKITREIRSSIYIPQETKKGKYLVTCRIDMDKSGKILDKSIIKSSGDARLDKYVLQGIARAAKVSAPPADIKNPLDLTFTLIRN